jgi:glycosyltransferase involved in cell wall biosynthesis
MEPILIFSTEVKNGKGGISTALVGFLEGLDLAGRPYEIITTHAGTGKFRWYLKALQRAFRVKKGQVCWFHLGPWFSILRKLSLMVVARARGGVVIAHLHSPRTEAYLANPFMRFLIRAPMRISSAVVVLTPWWANLLECATPGIRNVFVLSNPADQIMLEQAKKAVVPRRSTEVRLLTMARLVEGKGIEAVIAALTFLDERYSLIIAGTGPLEYQLKEMVNDLCLSERVTFVGWVDYGQKSGLLESADVFCLPSRNDSFGMVYLEAMAAGVPIVALKHGAIPDVVRDGKDGVLIIDDAPLAVANGIRMVAENSTFNPKEIKDSFVERFDNRMLVEKFLRDLLNESF